MYHYPPIKSFAMREKKQVHLCCATGKILFAFYGIILEQNCFMTGYQSFMFPLQQNSQKSGNILETFWEQNEQILFPNNTNDNKYYLWINEIQPGRAEAL